MKQNVGRTETWYDNAFIIFTQSLNLIFICYFSISLFENTENGMMCVRCKHTKLYAKWKILRYKRK